jgi:SAM-dependent methyltransferase
MRTKYELFDIVFPYIKDKEVLYVGCVDHKLEKSGSPLWVHSFLRKYSKRVIGFDILKEEIDLLKKKGYNVFYANAEDFELNKKFDVILAGEIIEHLSNPGLFLKQCKKHLKKEGFLILSTPSTFNLYENLKNVLFLRINPPVNPEHTFYYSPSTIKELIERESFKVEKIDFFDFYGSYLGKIRFNLFGIFGKKFKRRMVILAKLK